MASQHFKHSDWDLFCENIFQVFRRDQLYNYIKSHDINQCTDEQGNTLLHHAVKLDDVSAVCELSNHLIDPNIKNLAGQTALQLAQDAQARCLWSLQRFHLCIDFARAFSEPSGLDALFAAIYRGDATLGDTSGVEDDGNEKNEGNWTALQCAAMYGHPHLIRELHQRFPHLNADYSTVDNSPAIHLAAKHGHSHCIIALYECFPTIKAGFALQDACEYNRSACITTLHKCFPNLTGNELDRDHYSALTCAVMRDNPECVRVLHSHFPHIDPNWLDEDGTSALIAAVTYPNRPDCISALSECFPNIDPNKRDNHHNTALMRAMEGEWPDCITSLHSYFPNTNVNLCDIYGTTALMMAIDDEKRLIALRNCFPDIDPNMQDYKGNTALILASCESNSISIISQLQKLFPDIDPNIGNDNQETALMHMSRFNRSVQSIRHFVDMFPNVDGNAKNARGETALMFAITQGNASIAAWLLERFPGIYPQFNANPTGQRTPIPSIKKNRLGRYPRRVNPTDKTELMLAIKKNRVDLISMLLNHIIQTCQD